MIFFLRSRKVAAEARLCHLHVLTSASSSSRSYSVELQDGLRSRLSAVVFWARFRVIEVKHLNLWRLKCCACLISLRVGV